MANAILRLNFKERRNDNGKNDERIKGWVGGGVNQFNGFSGIRKVHQLERSWADALDLHHYRGDYRSSPVDPGGHSLLQLHRYYDQHGLQEREES